MTPGEVMGIVLSLSTVMGTIIGGWWLADWEGCPGSDVEPRHPDINGL